MDTRNQHYMLPYLILQVINIGRFKLLVCPKYKQIKLLQVCMYTSSYNTTLFTHLQWK